MWFELLLKDSGVKFGPRNILNILLMVGGVVDINKILCCSTGLFMLFTSEYEPDILIIVIAEAILSDEIVANNTRSAHHHPRIHLAQLV